MAGLLSLIGLLALVAGIGGLIRPLERIGITDRRQAARVVGAASVVALVGVILNQAETQNPPALSPIGGISLTTTTTTAGSATSAPGCHPSYVGQCVPVGVEDVDCRGGGGNGPFYTGRVQVVGPDVYWLDVDGNGIACETS